MLVQSLIPLALLLANGANGEPILLRRDVSVSPRMQPNSPSGGYAPEVVNCPSQKPSIRNAATLSPEETAWLPLRRNLTVQPMIDFLKRANISGFDAQTYITNAATKNISALPNIGIAVSGGGYRALMNGAGFIAAADNRTNGSLAPGGIGGLLQATTYLAGLSGGGWLVGSLFANNFTTVEALRDGSPGSSVWQFDRSIIKGPESSGISIVNTADYWLDVHKAVESKSDAGFETSITDYWGRTLSYQLINATDGGPAYTFSSISLDSGFSTGQTPFPMLVADERQPGTSIISLNATNMEFNPFEMGSWDPTTFGFAPTKFLASNFSGGAVPSDGHCVEGFDQSGFVMGTSSSLFNQALVQLTASNASNSSGVPGFVTSAIQDILQSLSEDEVDIARYVPNPFLGYNNKSNPSANDDQLTLVDGGEDLQNVPFTPLVQPIRHVDVIFAVDSSADTIFSWPNGTAMRASYDRSKGTIANGTLFPPVPDANTFINEGLNNRPTFFGCDVANFTLGPGQTPPPLIVYIPNAPYTAMSNVSTFDLSYPDAQRNDIIKNGLNAGSQGNSTLDARWPTCVGCAIMSRSWARTGTAVPSVCQACFTHYCWDGKLNSTNNGAYTPMFRVANETTVSPSSSSAGMRSIEAGRGSSVAMVACLAGLLLVM